MRDSLSHSGKEVRQADPRLADHHEPVAPRPWWRPGWLASPVVQGLMALAIYLAAWLPTIARPLLTNSGFAQLDQSSQDPNFYAWCIRWWPYALGHGLDPLYTHVIGSPTGYSLAWVTTIPPIAVIATPLTLGVGAVAAFNLLTALALPISGWAAFVLCRRLTHRFWPALVGGFVYGFSAYEMNHDAAGQLNLTYSLLLPIMAYLVVLWWDKSIKTRTFVILLGLVMAVQFYLFLETFADLTAFLIIGLALAIVLAGRGERPAMIRLTKLIGWSYLVAIVLAAPYLAHALMIKSPAPANVSGLDVASIVIPRPTRALGMAWLEHVATGPIPASAGGYVGIPLLVVAVLLAVRNWSSRLTRFLTYMLGIIVILSLGPVLYFDGHRWFSVPWGKIWELPILRDAYPSRLMLFAYLVLAVATALWLARPSTRKVAWPRWPLALLVIAAVVLDTPTFALNHQSSVPTYIASGQYRHDLSPGEVVLVVSNVGNAGMLWQADSNYYMRLAGGYINQAITPRSDLPPQIQGLSAYSTAAYAQFRAFVTAAHVGAILVDAAHEPLWVGVLWKMGLKGHLIGGVIDYPVHGCAACHPVPQSQIYVHARA